jgi:hypothetical protein
MQNNTRGKRFNSSKCTVGIQSPKEDIGVKTVAFLGKLVLPRDWTLFQTASRLRTRDRSRLIPASQKTPEQRAARRDCRDRGSKSYRARENRDLAQTSGRKSTRFSTFLWKTGTGSRSKAFCCNRFARSTFASNFFCGINGPNRVCMEAAFSNRFPHISRGPSRE